MLQVFAPCCATSAEQDGIEMNGEPLSPGIDLLGNTSKGKYSKSVNR